MATEQIWANQLRFYRETAPRSGVPSGTVWTIPVGPAAAARRTDYWGGRVDVFRNPQPLIPLHDYHEGRMSFSVGARMLGWLLSEHATEVAGNLEFDRLVPSPTFCLEIQTESDAFAFRGIAFHEIQIAAVPPELCVLDLAFLALDRIAIDDLTAATGDLWSDCLAANVCALAYSSGAWGVNPRVDNFHEGTFSAQIFLTRRSLAPAAFEPDGRPTRFTSVPWRVMADLKVQQSTLTQQAKTKATGRLALFLGPAGASLDLVGESVSLFSNDDAVKAVDFREESLMVEFHPDARGSLLSVRDTSGLIP